MQDPSKILLWGLQYTMSQGVRKEEGNKKRVNTKISSTHMSRMRKVLVHCTFNSYFCSLGKVISQFYS